MMTGIKPEARGQKAQISFGFWLLASGFAALLFLTTAACGYSLAGRGQFLPDYIRTIGVPPCVNQGSSIFNLDTMLTERLQSEFASHGHYRTEPSTTGVDAVLTCAIRSTTLSPAAFSNNQASRYNFIITASIEFKDVKADKVLWSNPSLQVREEYDVTTSTQANDPTAFFGQDQNALQRVAQTFARTVVTSVLEAF